MSSFHASNSQYGYVISVCYTKFWAENRNRPSYLSAYNCYSHATPYVKTHAAVEYTNTYGGCFDGETGKNITLETERIDSASSHAARALHSQKGCSGQLPIKQIQKSLIKVKLIFTTNVQNLSAAAGERRGEGMHTV